jgi:mannose-1-phosphate guanylyltransferase/mannose-6-phosphate isomerase
MPSFPSTAYGYIRQGASRADGSRQVERFIEKPNAARAGELLLAGNVLWNAGIFLTRAVTLIEALERHAPDIVTQVARSLESAHRETLPARGPAGQVPLVRPAVELFSATRSQSIDYAVMEKHDQVAVVPFAGQWSDVGSWNAVADLVTPDTQSNRLQGQGMVHEAHNTFVHAPHRPVVALGTRDLLIIDTPDAVLVAHRDHAEQVKDVVARLEGQRCAQAVSHRNRAEHWIVVKGTAEVTRGSDTFLLSENQSTYIPVGEVHRLRNPGKIELEMIEVQSGGYLGEDDIVRLEDTYGRAAR